MKNVLSKLRKTFLGLYREEQLSEYFYMLIKYHTHTYMIMNIYI